MTKPKTIDGYQIVTREQEADAVYDSILREFVSFAPDPYWPLSKSKWLRENGTGNRCYYVAFNWSR